MICILLVAIVGLYMEATSMPVSSTPVSRPIRKRTAVRRSLALISPRDNLNLADKGSTFTDIRYRSFGVPVRKTRPSTLLRCHLRKDNPSGGHGCDTTQQLSLDLATCLARPSGLTALTINTGYSTSLACHPVS